MDVNKMSEDTAPQKVLKEYRVRNKAEVWYEVIVDAETEEEALSIAKSDDDLHWEALFEAAESGDEFEVEEVASLSWSSPS
jgi:hypothetical protein